MKSAVFASLIAAAAAFAPARQQVASSSALKAFEDALGAQAPLGFFDPLGLVADGDQEKVCMDVYSIVSGSATCIVDSHLSI